MKIAINGCCHGELNTIYSLIPFDTDLLIICGDFQAFRNKGDMEAALIPNKYKRMGDFHDYYTGEREAPVVTIVVGGNHESLSYLQELRYGGWLAPSIYYLGEVGAVWYKGLLIGGVLGIFNWHLFSHPPAASDELPPYTASSVRLVYHTKPRQLAKGMLLPRSQFDIFISHDWPNGIEHYGNLGQLIRTKPYFEPDIANLRLGLPVAMALLQHIRPRYWCSGHMHVMYEAEVDFAAKVNANEIELDMDDEEIPSTRFIAVDKPGRKRKFVSVIEMQPVHAHPSLNSDSLWYYEPMAEINLIVNSQITAPTDVFENISGWSLLEKLRSNLKNQGVARVIPDNFTPVASAEADTLATYPSPQTDAYRKLFGIIA